MLDTACFQLVSPNRPEPVGVQEPGFGIEAEKPAAERYAIEKLLLVGQLCRTPSFHVLLHGYVVYAVVAVYIFLYCSCLVIVPGGGSGACPLSVEMHKIKKDFLVIVPGGGSGACPLSVEMHTIKKASLVHSLTGHRSRKEGHGSACHNLSQVALTCADT